MSRLNQYIVFNLHDRGFALRLSAVERVVRAVEVVPLPEAPEVFLGLVNLRGRIIPVVNTRKRFHLPERELDLSDQFIIARTSRRDVALVVDKVCGVVERTEQETCMVETILPETDSVESVVKLNDGMILILDLEQLLSPAENNILDDRIKEQKEAKK